MKQFVPPGNLPGNMQRGEGKPAELWLKMSFLSPHYLLSLCLQRM